MRVFVAGASGAMGRPVVKRLLEQGHQVTGLTSGHPDIVSALGAEPIVASALDAEETRRAVKQAAPDAIINLLTRIPNTLYQMPGQFRENNRLRTAGTANLIAAAEEIGVDRLIGESITFAFHGRSEEKMKPMTGMGGFQASVDAAVSKEKQTLAAGGVVLRYALFYGPGTSLTELLPAALKKRRLPILGKGTGWWSFIHLDDGADATIAALDKGRPGEIYNICDDEPLLSSEALDLVASLVGGKLPRRLPAIGPRFALAYFNHFTGADNSKAKAELEWAPRYPTFREGFPATIRE